MPRRRDDHPAHSHARGTLFQVYARDREGETYQVTPPSSLAVVKLVIETLSPGMAQEGVVLWLERLGGKGGLSERDEIEERGLQSRAVAQLRDGAVETDFVGAVQSDLRVCAGRRYPVDHREVQRLISEDLKKWTSFCLAGLTGGLLVLLYHFIFNTW